MAKPKSKALGNVLQNIPVLAELARLGIKYEFASGEKYVKVHCPFHDDTSPSCHVDTERRTFRCMASGCETHGDFITLVCGFTKQQRSTVATDLAIHYGSSEQDLTISPSVVESAHMRIWQAGPLLAELYARGVTDELIRYYRLGEIDGRVSIPVPNEARQFVNIRKYLPGAPGAQKMLNMAGHGAPRLYPIEQIEKYNRIVLCGGECKAIVAASQLNPHGIGAVCVTAGEGKWGKHAQELVARFQDKTVYVCMDVDEAGRAAAAYHCQALGRVASWVGNLELPLDTGKYPKGDINDFVASEGGNLLSLIEQCPQWIPTGTLQGVAQVADDTPPERVNIGQAVSAEYVAKRIEVQAVISAADTSPYMIPREIEVTCDKSQDFCGVCAVFRGDNKISISPESPSIVDMVGKDKGALRLSLMSACGIPQVCRVCEFDAKSYHHVEDCRISPQLEISNRAEERTMQPALCVLEQGERGVTVNDTYILTGRNYPHPASQKSTLLISHVQPAKDALSVYADTFAQQIAELSQELAVFRPQDEYTVEGIGQQLSAIYQDLETNVTQIFQRRLTHLVVDLCYHSPLLITFDNRVHKGWADILILGDSGQGKSAIACGTEGTGGLMSHYGLGERVECRNASVAGLLGGCQQLGTRWFVTWGVIPTHDKRLVILEELKGASAEVISRLTDMRSSGIAEIPKIEKRRTHARTRLLSLSNTRAEGGLSTYNFGIEAVRELIGASEDIRRFDMVHLVARGDVDSAMLNIALRDRPQIEHRFTSELCRKLVLWAWTRTAEQVYFSEETTDMILTLASKMSEAFTDDIPIVDRGSMRLKLARLSAALAARLFCTDETGEYLCVMPCHVEYIATMLVREYTKPVFGYRDYTLALAQAQVISEQDVDAIRRLLYNLPHPADFAKAVLHRDSIDVQDVQDLCSAERIDAQQILSVLIRKHAVQRDGRGYRKTAPFIVLLKQMLESRELEGKGKPDFIRDKGKEY